MSKKTSTKAPAKASKVRPVAKKPVGQAAKPQTKQAAKPQTKQVKQPAHVPETHRKAEIRHASAVLKRANDIARLRAQHLRRRREAFTRAAKYAKEYATAAKDLIRQKRQAKNNGNFFREADSKVALVIRIRGINRISPKSTKILQLLRLRQIHNAVFVKLNKSTENLLRLVEPYITYGAPTQSTVSKLVYKRGFGKVNGNRIPLSDNAVVQEQLGKFGIVCVEDLIHEIYTVGPHFKEANGFIWPFHLSSPLGGFSNKRRHFTEGGQAGNREELINNLVARML